MRTLSLDLRERILSSYDRKEGTREEIAHRYRVSLGMMKKLLQPRRRTALECSLPAIHYGLAKMGLTYKKRHCGPASKTAPRSRGRAGRGGGARAASIPLG